MLFSTDLIDDMHKAFDEVCDKLCLTPTADDKATELVVTKIVELAKAGRRGDDLATETLRFFDACKSEHSDDRLRSASSISINSGCRPRTGGRFAAGNHTSLPTFRR
jgi:hypothetical protein